MSCQFCMLKSKLGVARFSAQGLTRLKSKCWLGFVLTWSLRGLIKVHLVVAELGSCGARTKVMVSVRALSFQRLPAIPCHSCVASMPPLLCISAFLYL